MKKAVLGSALLIFATSLPFLFVQKSLASTAACSKDGFTVVYVNGILTSEAQADADRDNLQRTFQKGSSLTGVKFITGYNATHLAGIGDDLKSIAQTYLSASGADVEDFDLQTILNKIAPDVTTQKILLIGHSQGSFYTNAMYDYLTNHGVPASAIAVYNLATPASGVAGKGTYLTSGYDRAINYIRELDAEANAPEPLPANILIPIFPSEANDDWAGHYFAADYLAGAPGQIVSDMQTALKSLKSSSTDMQSSCFTPPGEDAAYKAKALAFGIADPAALAMGAANQNIASAASAAVGAVSSTMAAANTALDSMAMNAYYSVFPKPDARTAAAGFSVVKALYGSGIDQETENELLGLNDPPTPPAAPAPVVAPAPAPVDASRPEAFKPKPYVPPPSASQTAAAANAVNSSSINYQPGYGGGGGAVVNSDPPSTAPANTAAPAPAPVSIELSITSPSDQASFTSGSVTFEGTSTLNAIITASGDATATVTADASGNWSISFSLSSGTSTLSFVASDGSGNSSSAVARTVGISLPPPGTPVPSIVECAYSLSTIGCVVPTAAAHLAWSADASTTSYEVYKNGTLLTTTSGTSVSVSLDANATSTFAVVGIGASGMRATSTDQDAFYLQNPLVINEVAWAGTDASPNDQWMELKNTSKYALDLSRVALHTADGSPYISLTGTVGSGSYYLVEHREEAIDVTADLVTNFDPLSQTGEQLLLEWNGGYGTTTLDATPASGTCAGWCAGALAQALGTSAQPGVPNSYASISMERIDGATDGTLSASWRSSDTYSFSAHDAGSDPVYGTPKAANSSGLPQSGWYCSPGTSIVAANAPLTPPLSCRFLSRFISPNVSRYVGFFVGDVGSSTMVAANSIGKNFAYDATVDGSGGAQGDHFFTAIWENRTNVGTDVQGFEDYFTGAASSGPPHTNFATYSWTWQ